MNTRWIASALLISLLLLLVGVIRFSGVSGDQAVIKSAQNVQIADGKQIVEIAVKGGYTPKQSVAVAGIPTTVRFVTDGTFDCSSAITIPSLNISKNLPQSGATDIDIGVQPIGTLQGTCTMGMYRFAIDFQEVESVMRDASLGGGASPSAPSEI
jgi:Cu+-exporting ATPase